MTGRVQWWLAGLFLCATACTSHLFSWEPDTHTVQRGDTVYSIAFRYGLDYRELARLNGLDSGYLIHPGDTLRLKPSPGGSTTTTAATGSAPSRQTSAAGNSSGISPTSRAAGDPAPTWGWPTDGEITARFNSNANGNKGINISGRSGQTVRAAAGGRVVYSGSGLIGYGPLIIVKHNNTYLSAYGHNRKLLVREADQVKPGQKIAEMGEGPGKTPVLHFEIRRDGKPVDPAGYLPRK